MFTALVGGADTRGTAVLVHGFTGSKEDFLSVLEPLAGRGWQVVAIDLPGHFESPHPDPQRYSHADLAAEIAELCGNLGGSVHLVGHSMGGQLCRAAVLDHDADIDSLTLLSSGPGRIGGQPAVELEAATALLPDTPLPQLWALKRAVDQAADVPEPSPDILDFLERRFLATSPHALLADARALLSATDRSKELAATATERGLGLLVVYGALEDNWPPEQIQQMAEDLNTVAVEIPACGHSPAVDAPTQTVGLLDEFFRTGVVLTAPRHLARSRLQHEAADNE